MIRMNAYVAPAVLIALAASLNAQANVQADNAQAALRLSEGKNQLVGSWVIAVVPDVPPGVPSSTNYVLHTNDSDGSLIVIGTPVTSSAPAIQNLGNQLSGAVGQWVSLGNRQFMETIVALIFKDGVPGGFQRTRTIVTLGETLNDFTGTAVAEFLDLKGTVVLSGTSKSTGTRVTWR
jgi:hypothetical protein